MSIPNQPQPMGIEEIYEDKRREVEQAMRDAFYQISDAIENDPEYTLADDELAELIYELMEIYIKE